MSAVVKSEPRADSWARPCEIPGEGEVGALLRELRERGELVIGPCEGESCRELPGTRAGGIVEKRVVQNGND